ncbi:MAG: sulfurtransferase TusA family protein [Promethearchaeota archaeon]|nr:MAG: sulfurtransferase TusA family protein [Candidatus Lokiarchaeota archaeon]
MSIRNMNNSMEYFMKKIDIRGKICPMTFVYTKLALEELGEGEILEVLLDFPAALENIPKNCKRQNLANLVDIKEKKNGKDEWILKLKKL